MMVIHHDKSYTKMAADGAQKDLMVKDTTPSCNVMNECGLEPLQFSWLRAAVRLYNALNQSNSSTARKILFADMQLSSRCNGR